MEHKDYYKILGLGNEASGDEIKKVYRRLAMQYHPDRNHGREEWANDKFKEINEAFSVLSNPEKRRQCDIGDIFGSQATQTDFRDLMSDFDEPGLGFDFLDNILIDNATGGFSNFKVYRKGFRGFRSTEFETQEGIDTEWLFERIHNPKVSSANYEIILSKEQAFSGTEGELIRKGRRLKIKIPAGVKMGSIIRLKDALNTTDCEPGDIFINIKII